VQRQLHARLKPAATGGAGGGGAQVLGWATLANQRVSQRARKKRGAGNFSRASLPYALNFLRRLFIPPRLEADRFFVQRDLNA